MQFNWQLILQPNTVVHCDTYQKANTLLAEADGMGLTWSNDRSYVGWNQWEIFKNKTCYLLSMGELASINYYKQRNYTILTYEDVLIKEENSMELLKVVDYDGEEWYTLEGGIRISGKLFKEEKTMKRIDMRKEYRDDTYDIRVYQDCVFFGLRDKENSAYDVTVRVGEKHLSLSQANTILAPFGYELYKATDWTKVEVGTKIQFTKELLFSGKLNGTRINLDNLKFKEWIPQTQQILILNGNKVEVYNEDEVELV
jgi:hypothetical protein